MRQFIALVGCLLSIAATASCGSNGTAGSTGGAPTASSTHGSASSGQSSSHGGGGAGATSAGGGGTANGGGGSGATGGSDGGPTEDGGDGGPLPDGGPCTTFKNCAQQGLDCGSASDGCGDMLDCGSCPAGQACGVATPNVCGCAPKSCAQQGFTCGAASDTCGTAIDCGTCPTGQACGATTANVCGCAPKSCAQQSLNCGPATDGCGTAIDCGTCPTGETCGAATANVCGCTPKNCSQQGLDCGPASDTCGTALNCGTCPTGQTCGATTANVCGCTPKSCAQQGLNCGPASDGCGNVIQCGTCTTGQTCGATTANVCGSGCTPKSCAQQGLNCGPATDTCGNLIQCGTCPTGLTCSVTTANVCGCTPKTCLQQGLNCGSATDTCGTALNCGTCPTGDTCGLTTPNVCGCAPKTCAQQGLNCGPASDGCGNLINCGTCAAGQTCGVTTPNVCACAPKTCTQQGLNCGPASDGCGNTINCGTCAAGLTCGFTTPNVCGSNTCVNLCLQQQTCSGGGTTSISGTVFAPNGTDPLAGATVYVPNAAVALFAPGVSCQSCSASHSGSPLVSAVTAFNGTFSISNMPAGLNIPLVIQKGRWRRQLVIPSVTACTNTALPSTGTSQLRMPRTKTEGDIPLMAFVTGGVDALECVLRKIGIADSEFSDPTGVGRVRFYQGSGAPGARYSAGTPSETTLWGTQAAINQYDMVYFACQGDDFERTSTQQNTVVNYANAGGRVLATHYSYVWLYNATPFAGTATWDVNTNPVFTSDPGTGLINTAFPRGLLFAQWLQAIGASPTLGQVQLSALRHDFLGVVSPSLLWLSVNDATAGNVPMQYTFDTPVGAAPANQCGRVLYNDYHIEDAVTTGTTFPTECTTTTMTPQEKAMEFMLFDLDDCVAP